MTLEMQLPVLSLNMTKFADVHPTLRQVVVISKVLTALTLLRLAAYAMAVSAVAPA